MAEACSKLLLPFLCSSWSSAIQPVYDKFFCQLLLYFASLQSDVVLTCDVTEHLKVLLFFLFCPTSYSTILLLCWIAVSHVSRCILSIWLCVAVLCLKIFFFLGLSAGLHHSLFCRRSWSFHILKADSFPSYQLVSLSTSQHYKEQCSTLDILLFFSLCILFSR